MSREERRTARPIDSELRRLLMPLDVHVMSEARRLAALKGVRVEDLTACIAQDPVLVMEFLKEANAICLSEGKPVLFSLARAIDRLGSQSILRLLSELKKREHFELESVNYWFEIHRSRCRRTSMISRMFAEVLIKHLADDCQLSGLFLYFGDLISVSYLQDKYVALAEEYQRGTLHYRIQQNFKFDPQKVGPGFLRNFGVPEILLGPVDHDAVLKGDRGMLKTVIAAAGEMIDAFDSKKWEKISPGGTLPVKSSLRLLVISKIQYLKIYERATEYLNEIKKYEDRIAGIIPAEDEEECLVDIAEARPHEDILQDEIQNLLLGIMTDSGEEEKDENEITADELARDFDLIPVQMEIRARSEDGPKKIAPPELQSSRGNAFVNAVSEMFESVKTSEELLTELLEKLTFDGHFEKAAIIALSKDRKNAIIVAARGTNLKHGQRMHIKDELSPLAQCFSKVQSFGNVSSENSPFGSKAFAVAPLNANHKNPVALYADCGADGSLTFEARRVFRTVVEMVNQKLVQLPGGIPLEIDEDY